MKRLVVFCFIIILSGCSDNYCSFLDENKDSFESLVEVINNNPNEFFNTQSTPRVYYTYNYQKSEQEFQKSKSSKNIDSIEFNSLKKIFNDLSIEEFYIYDDQSLLFKINNKDFFVSEYGLYIAYLENRTVDELRTDFEILKSNECKEKWYFLLERSSIAD